MKTICIAFFLQSLFIAFTSQAQQLDDFVIDDHTAEENNSFSQSEPAAAFDGTNYFVVFADDRNSYLNIYGARITAQAVVMDTDCFAISSGICGDQETPEVAFGANKYLVVWQDSRYLKDLNHGIYGTFVSCDDEVSEPEGFVIANNASDQTLPQVVFDGTNFFVVWQDEQNGQDAKIYGARISPDGAVLDSNGFLISALPNSSSPVVAFCGTNYLVVWISDNNVWGARISTNGILMDQTPFKISTADAGKRSHASVTFDGTNYFVVWTDSRAGEDDIYGARINMAGTVLDPINIPVSTAFSDQKEPSVIFNGTAYIAAWEDDRNYEGDIYGARVTTGASVIQELNLVNDDSAVQYETALAHGAGSQVLVVYTGGWQKLINEQTYSGERIWAGLIDEPSVGIYELAGNNMMQLYPNPCNEMLHLQFNPSQGEFEISIRNLFGEEMKRIQGTDGQIEISVRDLASGTYFCNLIAEKFSEDFKFIVQH